MKVSQITVHAGRTLPHPLEEYAYLRIGLSMQADLSDGDDLTDSLKTLQRQAELRCEEHAATLRASLLDTEQLASEAKRIKQLEADMWVAGQELERLKQRQEDALYPAWLEKPQSDAGNNADPGLCF